MYECDNSKKSALHWAAFYGADNSAAFCMAWGFEINLCDSDLKMTPLHLAVNAGIAFFFL